MRTLPILLVPSLASTLLAQAYVSPQFFTRMEGSSWSNAGLGSSSAPSRMLQIHEDLPARSVAALSFRRDGQTTTASPAFSLVCSVFMSTAATTAAQPSATFDSNHGGDKRSVAANQVVQFPASAHDGFGAPFTYRLPLPSPYQHSGSGPLCFEVQMITTSATSATYFDAASASNPNPGGLTEAVGQGCRRSASSSRASLSGSFQPNWPANSMTLAVNGNSLPLTQLATLAIGDSATQWAGLTLPFELPGTASAPSGPCSILSSMLISLPQFTTANGTATASLGYRPHRSMRGREFFMQLVVPEPAANAWGLVLTNAVRFHPQAPWTAVPIGQVAAANLGATGTVRANYGQIVAFE
ncbi:MAG: hypothetical protein R3F56_13265 [Planctomycetota bacterium]